jgi:uncharacterized MAPEG superfamily protein
MILGTSGSVEMEMLWLSIVLGLAQLLLATLFSVAQRGFPWGVGARDQAPAPLGKLGARFERALRNFLETFAFFAAAVLMAEILHRHNANTAIGAQVYFWARVAYVPAYGFGIPFVRTAVWGASLVGLVMALAGVWPG